MFCFCSTARPHSLEEDDVVYVADIVPGLSSSPMTTSPVRHSGVESHICNFNTWELETEGAGVQSQPQQCSQLEDSLLYPRISPNNNRVKSQSENVCVLQRPGILLTSAQPSQCTVRPGTRPSDPCAVHLAVRLLSGHDIFYQESGVLRKLKNSSKQTQQVTAEKTS